MLGLTLREEFRGKRLKGTAIELSNDNEHRRDPDRSGRVPGDHVSDSTTC